jgi:methyltransferase (TIGR00027 family)
MPDPVIRNISDTARWTAAFRARESERPDALFRDPVARKLAGERGEQIVDTVKFGTKHTWSWITRTVLFDRFIQAELDAGADMIINLAAGLDARPYRMNVRPDVQWIEVDLPEITAYKEEVLKDDKPKCSLRRVRMDLSDRAARQALFAELKPKRALVISEGLLIYLTAEQAGELASDLKVFDRWVFDIASPALLKLMVKEMGSFLDQANAPLKFAPAEGPHFFDRFGWRVLDAQSMLHNAAKIGRLPWTMRIWSLIPPPKDGAAGEKMPWSGVALLERRL